MTVSDGSGPALLVQVVVTGLAAGAAYALVALGFVVVYRMAGILQLAHGHVVSFAMVMALAVLGSLGPATDAATGRALGAVLAAVIAAAALSALVPMVGWRDAATRHGPGGWIALVVAVAYAIEAALTVVSRRAGWVFPELLPRGQQRVALPFGTTVDGHTLWQLVLALALAVALDVAMRRTATGGLVAAVASDPKLAELAGLPVRRTVVAAFAAAGALAAVAGVLVGSGRVVEPASGVQVGLWGIAAAAVTGFGSNRRVLAAALVLGVLEAMVVTYLPLGPFGSEAGAVGAAVLPALVVATVLAVRPAPGVRDVPA